MAPKSKTSMVHVRVEETLKDDASNVFAKYGLTTSEAVRIFLTRTVAEQGLPFGMTHDKASYDEWFKASVREAMEDTRASIPHAEVMASLRATLSGTAKDQVPSAFSKQVEVAGTLYGPDSADCIVNPGHLRDDA